LPARLEGSAPDTPGLEINQLEMPHPVLERPDFLWTAQALDHQTGHSDPFVVRTELIKTFECETGHSITSSAQGSIALSDFLAGVADLNR
jgi:hypothetical protein